MESEEGAVEAEGADAGGAAALELVTAVGASCVEEDRGDESDEGCTADALPARHKHHYLVIVTRQLFIF